MSGPFEKWTGRFYEAPPAHEVHRPPWTPDIMNKHLQELESVLHTEASLDRDSDLGSVPWVYDHAEAWVKQDESIANAVQTAWPDALDPLMAWCEEFCREYGKTEECAK